MLNAYLQNLTSKQKTFSIIGLIVALLFVAYGNTRAAIPNNNGEIAACYRSSASLSQPKGALRVIDKGANENCTLNEVLLEWSQGKIGSFVNNLAGAEFTGASLQYRNFVNTNFTGADFSSANLTGSNLKDSNFTNTVLSSATIKKVNAKNANFDNTTFSSVEALESNFQNTNFSNARFSTVRGGDFRNANFTNISIDQSLESANLSGLDFTTAQFNNSAYIIVSDLSSADFSGMDFEGIGFSESNLTSADFSSTNFIGNIDYYAVFSGSNLSSVNFTNVQFKDTRFINGTDLSTATLTGATWDNVTCPDGTNSDNNGNTCIGHLVP